MKKFLFLPIVIMSLNMQAQNIRLGVSGGGSVSNYKARSDNMDETLDSKAGLTAGVLARIALKKYLILQPEINWVQKGIMDKQYFGGTEVKISLTTNNIEIPVNIMYGSEKGFFVGGGPTFSFGVGGNLKGTSGGSEYSEKIHFGNGDNDIMRSFDFGLNITGGYQFKNGLLVRANYNLGLSDLSNESGPGAEKLNSSYFGIRVGYLLNFPKKK